MNFKARYEDYTESEFIKILDELFENKQRLDADAYDRHSQAIVQHFEEITEYPDGSDVIFYPDPSREDSPSGILEEVKAWRAAHGKPGFKQA